MITVVLGCHSKPTLAQVLKAIERGDDAELECLLDRGTDPDAVGEITMPGQGTFARTALGAAISLRHDHAVELLLAHHARANQRGPGLMGSPGRLPLEIAAMSNDVAAIRALLAAGASPDGDSAGNESPAALAANFGQLDALDALLVAGAKVDGTGADGTGYPPLALAAEHLCVPCVKRLLAAGAQVDRRDVLGMTALNHVVAKENIELVDILLAAKADPMVASRAGWTPAFTAQYHGEAQVMDRFRKLGVTDFGMQPPPPLPPSGMGTIRVPVVEVKAAGQ